MPRRKRYPKLPNGFGSIKYLGKGRHFPYGVFPPVTEFNEDGKAISPKALCYVDDWMKGFRVLTAYKAGDYVPGYELQLEDGKDFSGNDLAAELIKEVRRIDKCNATMQPEKTFEEVYNDFFKYKYETDKSKTYSESTRRATTFAFKHLKPLYKKEFRSLRYADLQSALTESNLSHSTQEQLLSLLHQIYNYADLFELCDKDYSTHLQIMIPDDDRHGIPLSDMDLKKLWKNKDDPTIEMIIIMCYSGFRINEYPNLEINTKKGYFKGGIKTRAGKNRVVPIHSGILPLVENRIKRDGKIIGDTQAFRKEMYAALEKYGITHHRPHDCRHTFSMLLERYKVHDNDRKRLLGHSFNGDVTNEVYGHRSLQDLREEIEKVKICY